MAHCSAYRLVAASTLLVACAFLPASAAGYLKIPDIQGESKLTAAIASLAIEPDIGPGNVALPVAPAPETASGRASGRRNLPAADIGAAPATPGTATMPHYTDMRGSGAQMEAVFEAGAGRNFRIMLEPVPEADAFCQPGTPVSGQAAAGKVMIVITDGMVRSCQRERISRAAKPGERCPRGGCFEERVVLDITGTIQDEARGLTAVIR